MTPTVPPTAPPAAAPTATPHHLSPRPVPVGTGWVVTALLACWPLAIPALLGARRAAAALGAGDLAGAAGHARTARGWGVAALAVGIALSVVLTVALLVAAVAGLIDLTGGVVPPIRADRG